MAGSRAAGGPGAGGRWRWPRRAAALVVGYLAWGVAFGLLEEAVVVLAGAPSSAAAGSLAMAVVGGCLARWLAGPGRFLPVALVVVSAVDTIVAAVVAPVDAPALDFSLRAIPLAIELTAITFLGNLGRPRA